MISHFHTTRYTGQFYQVKMSSCPSESSDFTVGRTLGQGGFGRVCSGTFKGCDVAIKKVRIGHLDPNSSPREYQVVMNFDHPNVLKLLHWQDKEDFRLT